jgi:hypothetical protein
MAATHFSGPVISELGFQGGASSVESLAAAKSLDVEDSGKTFFLNLAGGFTVTLPVLATLAAGWKVRIVIGITPTTAYIVTENTASDTNKLVGNVNTSTAQTAAAAFNATGFTLVTFVVSSGAVKGDYIDIITDGSFYYVSGSTTVPAAITFT